MGSGKNKDVGLSHKSCLFRNCQVKMPRITLKVIPSHALEGRTVLVTLPDWGCEGAFAAEVCSLSFYMCTFCCVTQD